MSGRVLYYALGGGLGHLTRATAFLRQQGLADRAAIVSASAYQHDPRITAGIATLAVPDRLETSAAELRVWLRECIEREQPELVCVDCFPGGILGELCDFPELKDTRLWHVARLLRWPVYAESLQSSPPHYECSWRIEPLHPVQQAFLESHSDQIKDLAWAAAAVEIDSSIAKADPYWLVLHSGPAAEVTELLAYALEMRAHETAPVRILVCSPQPPLSLPDGCQSVDQYPATQLIHYADRVISAAGFNVLRDTAAVRDRLYVIPFPRRFDDQFERARRLRRSCTPPLSE